MNVIIWARVSSREQREGYSIDAQLRFNRDKAHRMGWNVVKEFSIAESARRGAERHEFNSMVAWVKANAKHHKIEAILSHKLDRICRNMRDAVRMQELEDKYGIKLAFVDNEFGPGAAGMLSFNVMAAVAQYYSDNLRTEVLKGITEKARQGWAPGLAPFGYVNDGDDKNEPIKPHPDKATSRKSHIPKKPHRCRESLNYIHEAAIPSGHLRTSFSVKATHIGPVNPSSAVRPYLVS